MELLEVIQDRQSIRNFKDIEVLDEDLQKIFHLATKVPTAFNAQETSIIYTKDKEKIEKLSVLCGNQPQVLNSKAFILLVNDIKRIKTILEKKKYELKENIEMFEDMFKIDAGIMANSINLIAHNFGYGSTIIGGALQNKEEIKKMFNIPKENDIQIAMIMGVASDIYQKINTKPKLDENVIAMKDEYRQVDINTINNYDKKLRKWFESINANIPLYSDTLCRILGTIKE